MDWVRLKGCDFFKIRGAKFSHQNLRGAKTGCVKRGVEIIWKNKGSEIIWKAEKGCENFGLLHVSKQFLLQKMWSELNFF